MRRGSFLGTIVGAAAANLAKSFLFTDETGQRRASWHVYVLIWLLPAVFASGTLILLAEAFWKTTATEPTTGRVVQVYDWDGNFGPVFRYTWTDGRETDASTGMSSPEWNFAIGSSHNIRYFADRKTDVVLVGPHNWFVAGVIGSMTICFVLVSFFLRARLRRWLFAGSQKA